MTTRIERILQRVSATTVAANPVSDGRSSIGASETTGLAAGLSKGADPEGARAIDTLIRESARFESLETYATFTGAVLPGRYAALPRAKALRAAENDEGSFDISAMIGGTRVTVATVATPDGEPPAMRVVGDGRFIVWEAPGSVGGFEDEGQALLCYDARSGLTTRVMDGHWGIDALSEVRMTGGRSYVLVSMSDSGEGAGHVAIVDPTRGTVFQASHAAFGATGAASVTVRSDDGERTTLSAETLAHASVVTNTPDDFADDELRLDEAVALYASGGFSPVPFEALDNEAIIDVVERLRVVAESYSIDNDYEALGYVEMFRADVVNEYEHSNEVFVVRTTLGADVWTYFVDPSGEILLRQAPSASTP